MVAPILSADQPPFQTQLLVQVVYYGHPQNLKSTAHTENVQYQQTDTTRYNHLVMTILTSALDVNMTLQ